MKRALTFIRDNMLSSVLFSDFKRDCLIIGLLFANAIVGLFFPFLLFIRFSTMSENVNEIMERMVPDLQDLESNSVFSHVSEIVFYGDC